MKREIKFRAWDEKNNEMIYPHSQIESFTYYSSGDILNRYSNVMQYTGLKDRSGKEIYEGDIVQFEGDDGERDPCDIVIYDTIMGLFRTNAPENCNLEFDPWEDWSLLNAHNKMCYVVVGNIHENPELLNNKNT